MDRALGKNLEALAEEDDEEEEEEFTERSERSEQSETDSDSEDDYENELARQEPNKFDGLCDGVMNAMGLVHASMSELLELKDELLDHSLPPTLLINLALISAKVFRSVSDLNMPMNELVRLVRVYSTPWEEKSAALKKLHEDYESKQRQLNIAIKRLQLVDAHSKRIAKEKRIMNWEKLFSKVTTTKGHGRRWKFLIETIKQKAKMGLEHVQEYTKALEQASDSEDGEEEMVDTTKATESSPDGTDTVMSGKTEETESRGDKDDEDKGHESDSDESDEEQDVPTVTIDIAQDSEEDDVGSDVFSRSASPKKVRFDDLAPPPVIKPPMRDAGVDTADPDYDIYLNVRIFAPEDLNHRGLKCSVTYGDQLYKTGVLDYEDDKTKEKEPPKPKLTPRPQGAGRGRASPMSKTSGPTEEEKETEQRYEEFMVKLPDEIPRGAQVFDKAVMDAPKNVQIAVHHGQFEEMIAMATLELEDLKELDLRTIYLPPPKGDDDVPRGFASGKDDDLLSLSDSIDLSFDESEAGTIKREDPVKGVDPLPFPLFSLHGGGRSDSVHVPCGNLPLVLYWGKQRRPPCFNRQVGTLGINEVVYDLTGIDLNTTTKEDLNKEMRDEALSAIQFTPEPQEETVAKTEFDELEKKHSEELEEMKDSYEKQLKALLENINQLEEERTQLIEKQQTMRVVSPPSRASTSPNTMSRGQSPRKTPAHSPDKLVVAEPEKVSVSVPASPAFKHRPLPPAAQKPRKNFRVGKPLPKWGEDLPQDFFDRLRLYEEESKQHMAELNEKTLREIRDSLEKKLAGQHRLSKREEAMYDALKDVSLPALFMPFRSGTVFNPRAHQYFHPTGSTDLRLTQPPSMFQLPPLTKQNKLSVCNLFELSSNFSTQNQSWLMDRYIQQQQPLPHGTHINPSVPTSGRAPYFNTQNSQLTDSGLDPANSQNVNPSLPEQEVES